MPQPSTALLEPRKSPVQARSAASVDAILQATTQVLLQTGKECLTTTRVAARAGVSIGTLYQYFPNKSALLQAALKRHFDAVGTAVECACEIAKGQCLACMAGALVSAFLGAKMQHPKTSMALYSVGSDVDGVQLAKELAVRTHRAITEMLRSATDRMLEDPELTATMLQGAMAGVSRRLLESEKPVELFEPLQRELIDMVSAYLQSRSSSRSLPGMEAADSFYQSAATSR